MVFDIRKTSLYAESWNVAYRNKKSGSILDDSFAEFIIIENSWRYWAADPFIYELNGKVYIFAELYDYMLRRGVIGVCELIDNKCTKWKPIIVEKHHLSYPCIVEYNGKQYIMPESGAAKELVLYEAIDFPNLWKKSEIIRENVCYADTTPLDTNGLAITHDVKNPYHPELIVIDLFNKSITKKAPMISELKSRPAGKSFYLNSENYRPVQVSNDFETGYGKGLLITKWEIDDAFCFSEDIVKEIKPMDLKYSRPIFLDGMHTYNSSENYEVIDIKTRRFNMINLIFRILNKFIK